MAFTMPDYPMLKPEQVNPFNAALTQAFKTYGQGLQAAYAKPNMEQALQKAILENKWNPKIWESEIGLRGAQAGLAGAEANKANFLTKNPQYISPEGMLISQAMGQGRGGQSSSQGMPQGQDFGANNQASPEEVQQIAQNGNGSGGGQQGQGYQPTPQEQQAMNQMQPGQSMVMGQRNGPQQSAYQPPQSMAYDPNALAYNPPGLPPPTMLNNILWAKGYNKDPSMIAQLELAQKQAEKYQTVNVDKNNQFNEQAIIANQSTIDAHKFLDALDRTSGLETGYWFGKTPALRDATQEMEAYGNAMAASATQLFKDGKAIHESDITLNQLAKPNRLQNKDVAFDLANGVIAKNDRLRERQQAYAFATQQKIKPEIMDAMWSKYETDRPYMDPETKMPNDAYKGTWKDYFTPEAVNAFLHGQEYVPPSQKVLQGFNWTKDDLKSIQDWAKKKGKNPKEFDKKHLYDAAKEEKTSLAGLKQGFMKLGAV